MDRELVKLYDELTKVSTYDRNTKTYYVSKEDYYIFGLSNDIRRNKINKYANDLGVVFDIPYKCLPDIQGESLFREYNIIRSVLEKVISDDERSVLEEKRIVVRNKIVEYNMDLIKTIINRKLNSSSISTVNENYTIEDLYHMGYEYLVNYIDSHYLENDKFRDAIKSLLIIGVKRDIEEEMGISDHSSRELLKIRKLLDETGKSIKEISSLLNLDETRVVELINLDNIVNPVRYDDMDELYELDGSLDERLIFEEQDIKIHKILEILLIDSQKKLVELFCGFNGEDVHTYRGVASRFGVSEGTICHRRKAVFNKLSSHIITRYIKQIMDINLLDEEKNICLTSISAFDKRLLRQLECFLLRQLDRDVLDLLMNGLSNNSKEVIYIFLGYSEKNDIYINNCSLYQRKKEQVLDYIRNRITEIYVVNNKNEEIDNYLDFLMYYYLNNDKKKVRIR